FTSMPLNDVLPMATSVPAEAMGWQDQRGVLKPGADADVIVLNENLKVEKTFILGNEVYYK
ncbi:MAG: amidohydrolase family protein, partial [Actinobacteria bacterium]|nr:amidohydrolase family protein [Actinomycetota bacterium]